MTEVLLIGGDEATQEAVAKGLAKFDQIFQKKTIFDLAKNYAIALNLYEERKHKVIFLAKEPSKEEINFIVAAGVKWSQNTTIFAQKKDLELLGTATQDALTVEINQYIAVDYVFDLMRSTVGDAWKKLDTRVLSSIVTGLIDLFDKAYGIKLIPQKVNHRRAQLEVADMSALCSFYGDGLQGTIVFLCSQDFVNEMARDLLNSDAGSLSANDEIDLIAECINQLLGVVVGRLQEVGYNLRPSVTLCVRGNKHEQMSRLNGKLFAMPFTFENKLINITLCYDTYLDSNKNKVVINDFAKGSRLYDVRLANVFTDAIANAVEATFGTKCQRVGNGSSIELRANSARFLSFNHGCGSAANYVFVVEMKESTARILASKMLQMPSEEIMSDMVADSCGELFNQVMAQFRSQAEAVGYLMKPVVHADFSSGEEYLFLIKSLGRFVTFKFKTDEFEFQAVLGIDSAKTPKLLDLFACVRP